ncbi:flagellar biosynthetic protein FliO [Ferrovibrio sp.]|uniref:flagellar biosynthetic protein FliO n=1 Tax=Ferrovibrio sp. TaxID=1917215 RepID=UPI002619512A|nr:flagellar biosynthetic protein FliO [Ferrovibrio sp.]
MDSINFTQVAIAFGGLLVLLALFYYGARALSGTARFGKWRPGQRIGVVDSTPVDGTRRLVLIRRDDTEHLLLLGSHGDVVIETGIPVTRPDDGSPAPESGIGGWPTLRVPGKQGRGNA